MSFLIPTSPTYTPRRVGILGNVDTRFSYILVIVSQLVSCPSLSVKELTKVRSVSFLFVPFELPDELSLLLPPPLLEDLFSELLDEPPLDDCPPLLLEELSPELSSLDDWSALPLSLCSGFPPLVPWSILLLLGLSLP